MLDHVATSFVTLHKASIVNSTLRSRQVYLAAPALSPVSSELGNFYKVAKKTL